MKTLRTILVLSLSICFIFSFGDQASLAKSNASKKVNQSAHQKKSKTKKKKGGYVPNQVIVKFKDSVTECVECLIENQESFERAAGPSGRKLDEKIEKHRIKKAKPLFRKAKRQKRNNRCQDIRPIKEEEEKKAKKLRKKYKKRSKRADQIRKNKKLGQTSMHHLYILDMESDESIHDVIRDLEDDDNIEYAQPNYFVETFYVPNDPFLDEYSYSWGQEESDLWGHYAINVPQAWEKSQGEGIVVAVVDTGVDFNHRDLFDNIWVNPGEVSDNNQDGVIDIRDLDILTADGYIDNDELAVVSDEIDNDQNGYVDDVLGWDFSLCKEYGWVTDPSSFILYWRCIESAFGNNNPLDEMGHGTHVAGTVSAVGDNGEGMAGIAYKAKIMPVKGLNKQGSGTFEELAAAYRYAVEMGADVINNSWGCVYSCPENPVIEDVVRQAYEQGVVTVFAAGNSSSNTYFRSPQSMLESKPIVVGASTPQNDPTFFSNYGVNVDIVAPGGNEWDANQSFEPFRNILSLQAEGVQDRFTKSGQLSIAELNNGLLDYVRQAGTSMSAPHVAGMAALILSAHPGEPFADIGTDGISGTDDPDGSEGNGVYDEGEPFEDTGSDGIWGIDDNGTEGNDIYDSGFSNEEIRKIIKATGYDLMDRSGRYVGYDVFTSTGLADADEALNIISKEQILNVEITTPEEKAFFDPSFTTSVEIRGSVMGSLAAFQEYQIYYGRGYAPLEWTPILAQPEQTTVENDVLGHWMIEDLQAGIYWIRLEAKTQDGYIYDDIKRVTIEIPPICISNTDTDQYYPRIDGNIVVWQDNRFGNWDIFWYDVSTGIEDTLPLDSSALLHNQTKPDLSGDYIVWQDDRNGYCEKTSWGEPIGNCDIFAFNLVTREVIQITSNDAPQLNPRISGHYIVFEDRREGRPDIFVYNFQTGLVEKMSYDDPAVEDYAQTKIDIDDNSVSFYESQSRDLRYYDLTLGLNDPAQSSVLIKKMNSDFAEGHLDDHTAVWSDILNGYYAIYIKDLDDPSDEGQVLGDSNNLIVPPNVRFDGDRIVWHQLTSDALDIYLYDLEVELQRAITGHEGGQLMPDISGSKIVWQDNRDGDFDIFMLNINHAPQFLIQERYKIEVEEKLNFTVYAQDEEEDELSIWLDDQGIEGVEFDTNDFIFFFEPTPQQIGSHEVFLYMSDGETEVSKRIVIDVFDPNRENSPPILNPIGGQTVEEESFISILLSANDPEGDPLTFTVSNLPRGAQLENNSILFRPTLGQGQTYLINVSVSDGEFEDEEDFELIVENLNRPPILLTDIPDLKIMEYEELQYLIDVIDHDNDTLTYTLSPAVRGATISPDGLLEWTPDESQAGSYQMHLEIDDGTESITVDFTIEVINGFPNSHLDEYSPYGNSDIYGTRIAWSSGNNIAYYDYGIPEVASKILTTEATENTKVAIYGNNIVWKHDTSNGLGIVLYNLSHPQRGYNLITRDDARPVLGGMDGNLIVWHDYRDGPGEIYACIYDEQSQTCPETRITNDRNPQTNPKVRNNTIVWQDERHGQKDIYMCELDLTTGLCPNIRLTTSEADEVYPVVSKEYIAWHNEKDQRIYRYNRQTSAIQYMGELTRWKGPRLSDDWMVWIDKNGLLTATYMETGQTMQINDPTNAQYNSALDENNLVVYYSSDFTYYQLIPPPEESNAVQIESPQEGEIIDYTTRSLVVEGRIEEDVVQYELFYQNEDLPSQWVSFSGPISTPQGITGSLGTLSFAGLNPGHYSIKLVYFDRIGWETSISVNVELQIPGMEAPVLSAPSVQPTEVHLEWTDTSSIETGFKIYRYRGEELDPEEVIELSTPNTTSYVDGDLDPDTRYRYKMKLVYNEQDATGFSNEITAQTLAGELPTEFRAVRTDPYKVGLSWKDNSNRETGYLIEYFLSGVKFYEITLNNDTNFYVHDNNYNSENQHYILKTIGTPMDNYEVTAQLEFPNIPRPEDIEILQADADHISVEWTGYISPFVDNIKVWRNLHDNPESPLFVLNPNERSFTDTQIEQGFAYRYLICYCEQDLCSDPIDTWYIASEYAPSHLRVLENKSGQITIAWEDNSITESSFYIHRYENGELSTQMIIPDDSQQTGTMTFVDEDVIPGNEYEYYVEMFARLQNDFRQWSATTERVTVINSSGIPGEELVVGFQLDQGYNLIGLPIDAPSGTLNDLLSFPPAYNGATLYRWDIAAQTFEAAAAYFYTDSFVGWYPNKELVPGDGFMITLPEGSPTLLWSFRGLELETGFERPLAGQWKILCSQASDSMRLGSTSDLQTQQFPARTGDTVYLYDNSSQSYSAAYIYFGEESGWWGPDETDVNHQGPLLEPGQAFYLQAASEQ